jgi:excisionase family DNA binding protein
MKTLSRLEAAAFLKCDKSVVSDLFALGELPGAKVGRKMVFFESDLEAYLRAKMESRAATLHAIKVVIRSRRGRPRRELCFTS